MIKYKKPVSHLSCLSFLLQFPHLFLLFHPLLHPAPHCLSHCLFLVVFFVIFLVVVLVVVLLSSRPFFTPFILCCFQRLETTMSSRSGTPSRDSSPEAPGKKKQSPPPRTSPPRETATATASSQTTASRTGNQAAAAAAAANLPGGLSSRRPLVVPLRPPPPQASSAAARLTYTHAQLESYVNQSHEATEDHIVDAADHIIQVLGSHHISYAIMGGFSLRIRGSERRTFDVDLAVGGNMLQLRTAFTADSR